MTDVKTIKPNLECKIGNSLNNNRKKYKMFKTFRTIHVMQMDCKVDAPEVVKPQTPSSSRRKSIAIIDNNQILSVKPVSPEIISISKNSIESLVIKSSKRVRRSRLSRLWHCIINFFHKKRS